MYTALCRTSSSSRARHKLLLGPPDGGLLWWWGLVARQLHYDIPGLNRWERSYLVEQTKTVLETTLPAAPSAGLPPQLSDSRSWSFLESDLLIRRYISFLTTVDIKVLFSAVGSVCWTRVSQFRFQKKFRFEAKLSETETVSLRFASVSRNHKKVSLHFASFRFVSFALFC